MGVSNKLFEDRYVLNKWPQAMERHKHLPQRGPKWGIKLGKWGGGWIHGEVVRETILSFQETNNIACCFVFSAWGLHPTLLLQ